MCETNDFTLGHYLDTHPETELFVPYRIRQSLLNPDIKIEDQLEQVGHLLSRIKRLGQLLCPQEGDDVSITIPSWRLIELGLVRGNAVEKIQRRITRKLANTASPEDLEALRIDKHSHLDRNIVTLVRRDGNLLIEQSYITEEQEDCGSRMDLEVCRAFSLSDSLPYSLIHKHTRKHFHMRRHKDPTPSQPIEGEEHSIEPTAADLNTTLVLLYEGLKPGIMGSSALVYPQ